MAKKKTLTANTAEYKGKAGKSTAGKEFYPAHASMEALSASVIEVKEPRPYTSRYPISDKQFEKLKEAARKKKLPKKQATIAKDSGKKREMAATAIPQIDTAGGPVADAPLPSSNFAGITATGWLPPDCTMATGPNHVVLSVNSSVAVYNKAGGAALLLRTLTVWFSNVIQGATVFDPKLLFDQHSGCSCQLPLHRIRRNRLTCSPSPRLATPLAPG